MSKLAELYCSRSVLEVIVSRNMAANEADANKISSEKSVKQKTAKKRKKSCENEDAPEQKQSKVEEAAPVETAPQQADEPQQAEKQQHVKHHHKRKRHHFNAIRAQMEFYFGDANLSKDRYLKKLITQDPFVPLEIFLTFNKMKQLTLSVEEIAKSLSNSQLLELDETTQKVRRKTALPEERNVDENTLYVESLPSFANHDWVRQVFERFGPVTYVSLPKYVKSRKIKEFGFVEFEKQESVAKAVKAFEDFNGVLSMQEADPSELSSVKSYIKEQNEALEPVEGLEKADDKIVAEELLEGQVSKKKRKLLDEEEPLLKRTRTEENSEKDQQPITESKETPSASEAEQISGAENLHNKSEEDGDKKKRRKKKKKKVQSEKTRKREADLAADAAYFELKILPKRDWKRLRNKYLNLQREKIGELKRKAWQERQLQQQLLQQATGEHDDDYEESESKKTKTKLRAGMNMNFYGAGDDEATSKGSKEAKRNPALERAPLFSYEPGLIVEVALLEPCVNVKEFKADMKQYPTVKYVDIKEGSMLAHLRLESASASEEFVQRMNCAEYVCKVLVGEGETAYWQKIEQDREAKLNKQIKLPQKRGREKIKKIITQHIRFGDEE